MTVLRRSSGGATPEVRRRRSMLALAALGAVALASGLSLTGTIGRDAVGVGGVSGREQATQLALELTRSGRAGDAEDVQATLATPAFFRLTGRTAEGERLGAERGLLFVLTETAHYGELPRHPGVLLRLDGRIYAASEWNVLVDAVHHRTSAVSFAAVAPSVLDGDHVVELMLPPAASGARATLAWRSPLNYGGGAASEAGAPALARSLQRTIAMPSGDAKLLLATPAYIRETRQDALAREYGADRDLVLLITEDAFVDALGAPLRPLVRVDDRVLSASRFDVLTDSPRHRASVAVYRDPTPLVTASLAGVEAYVPDAPDRAVRWERPYADGATAGTALSLSLPAFLALFGGLLAGMWPCLLQLSAYFLPSVAGLSLAEAHGDAARPPVLRTALFFVSGIVIVYTAAGAAAGFAAQTLGGSSFFEDARRPITFVAGLVVLVMAVRTAVQARAPLVCKMPVLNMAGRFGNGPLGTVLLGLAFATGCMTCFGAALVLGMFAYVATVASPLAGAAILFLFSLGIAVPLVLASVAMARILPLLGHIERNARYLSLTSAAIMAGYAVLLLTGSTHLLSNAASSLVFRQ